MHFFYSQFIFFHFAGIFLFFLIALKGRRLVAALTAFLGAFMIIALGVVGYMHVTGVLPEFWKDCFVFNYLYQNSNQYFIHGFSSGSFMQSVYDTIRAVGAYIGFAIAGGVYMAVRFPRNSRRTWIAVVLGWSIAFVLDLALVSRCGRIYGYQCDPLRFWCVLALMPLVKECDAFFRSHNEKRYCALPITLAFLPIVSPMLLGELARIYLFIHPKTTNELKVAAAIEQIKEWPESPVMVWGNCGKFYLKSGRKFVSKYYSWTPFYVDGFLSDDELKETLRSILEERTIVVDKMSPDPVAGEGIYEDGWIHGLPKFKAELRNLLKDHYMARDLPGGARLYLPK